MKASSSFAPNPQRTATMRSICSFLETVTDMLVCSEKWGRSPIYLFFRRKKKVNRATTAFFFRFLLEECGRTPSPTVLVLFFCDFLDVVHIRCGLGQYVMEIIPDALEHESLVEEFANACCAEQEDAENLVV